MLNWKGVLKWNHFLVSNREIRHTMSHSKIKGGGDTAISKPGDPGIFFSFQYSCLVSRVDILIEDPKIMEFKRHGDRISCRILLQELAGRLKVLRMTRIKEQERRKMLAWKLDMSL